MQNVNIITHPLVQDKLALMRDKHTDSGIFRSLMSEISLLLCYEATHELPMCLQEIVTPLNVNAEFPMVKSKDIAFITVLRAGTGMLDGALKLIPTASVGHIGLYRDPKNYSIIEYYFKVPKDLEQKHVIIVDPIIATGHSAVAAVERIKEYNPQSVKFICLVAAPEGLAYLQQNYNDVAIYVAAIDQKLDARNYLIPGIGDAGDRMFGTA